VQKWEFQPQYSFQVATTQTRNRTTWDVQPAASILTPIGTQVTLSGNNADTSAFSPGLSLQVSQPLMRGFGTAIVENALNNAKDSEYISRLHIEGTLRGTITAVVNAYLDVVTAERNLGIHQDALKRAQAAVQQTKLFIKAGHKAGNEIITVEANVATAKTQLENDKNNLDQARYALLTAIGLDPNTDVKFTTLNVDGLLKKYKFPTKDQAKTLILENDIQYQTDQITLHGSTARSLMVAEDNTRWQLNLGASAATGSGAGPTLAQGVSLTLQIPINDQIRKQAVVNAKVALQQAELALKQERWSKETNAINGWNSVVSAKHALVYAETAEQLQEKTYQVSYQKYLHGLIDSLELQTAQIQLILAQQTLLVARIYYLKALVNVDFLIGNTLKTWDVKVRLS